MNYKIEGALIRNKKRLILSGILWLFLTIVLVMPLTYAWQEATLTGRLQINTFASVVAERFPQPMQNILEVGSYWNSFVSLLWKFTLVFFGVILIGIIKTAPKNKYDGIEHGSSDWCENGEQYKVLSPKKGILLAEKNYLPVDKRGNVNVLVVGRIRCG